VAALTAEEQEDADGGSGRCGSGPQEGIKREGMRGGGFYFALWSRAVAAMEEGSGEVVDRRRGRGGAVR
jgi:hypothetical protein